MSPADRRAQRRAAIREAGIRRARQSPPLTDAQVEALAYILAPSVAAMPRTSAASAA